MPRFFIRAEQVADDRVIIRGDDAHHISRSLRMATGERITVCDMQKNEYECELIEFAESHVTARILETRKSETEPPFFVSVFQALPKGDKLDSVIQKAVECGVGEVTTFESERCVVRAKGENEAKKTERRQRIALEAAKQSGRGIVPTVHPTCSFSKAIEAAARADIALFCYEGDGTKALGEVLSEARKSLPENTFPTISIVIGSEGGFSLSEVEAARAAGLIPVGLGRRILRTETAAAFALACLVYEFELRA